MDFFLRNCRETVNLSRRARLAAQSVSQLARVLFLPGLKSVSYRPTPWIGHLPPISARPEAAGKRPGSRSEGIGKHRCLANSWPLPSPQYAHSGASHNKLANKRAGIIEENPHLGKM